MSKFFLLNVIGLPWREQMKLNKADSLLTASVCLVLVEARTKRRRETIKNLLQLFVQAVDTQRPSEVLTVWGPPHTNLHYMNWSISVFIAGQLGPDLDQSPDFENVTETKRQRKRKQVQNQRKCDGVSRVSVAESISWVCPEMEAEEEPAQKQVDLQLVLLRLMFGVR